MDSCKMISMHLEMKMYQVVFQSTQAKQSKATDMLYDISYIRVKFPVVIGNQYADQQLVKAEVNTLLKSWKIAIHCVEFTDPSVDCLCRGQGVHSQKQQHVKSPAAGNMATVQKWVDIHMGYKPCVLGCTICCSQKWQDHLLSSRRSYSHICLSVTSPSKG